MNIAYSYKDGKFFPETANEEFNHWNKSGYSCPKKISKGYWAYLKWVKKVEERTLDIIHVDTGGVK